MDYEKLVKKRENPEFDINGRGFNIKAWYLEDDESNNAKGDSLIELRYEGKVIRQMLYPSYKIWNIAAHFRDIVDSEISNNARGYLIAGSDGLGGHILPRQITDIGE